MKPTTTASLMTMGLLFLTSLSARAAFTDSKCEHVLTGSGNIQINRQWDQESRVCFISLTSRDIHDLKYRDYYFSNEGEFMVFNSYGDGPPSTKTASRDFFIFPIVNEYPDYQIEENGDVTVKLVSGHLFRVSTIDFSVVSFTPGSFIESKQVNPNNKGGLEFNLTSGFWFDAGFKLGGNAFDNRKGKTTIKSALTNGQSCSLVNGTFLNYASDGNYKFKLSGDGLKNYVAQQCPKLKF